MKKTILRLSRTIHKWAGLLLAVQILLWILGGLIMSSIPLEKVHGKHLAKRVLDNPLVKEDYIASLDKILNSISAEIVSVQWSHLFDIPVFIINTDHDAKVFNAQTGQPFAPLSEQQVRLLAKQHYTSNGEIESALLLDAPKEASRAIGKVWQVDFNDTWSTTLYFDPNSAELMSIRSDIWRIFDFFWMLHIMDYDEREDFNNPLLISFSASALIFTLSGIVLLFSSRYLPRKRRK